MAAELQILDSHRIDTAKWDSCVYRGGHGLIYATVAYLNTMADNWSGIIVNDYETVMPLPWRKKLGVKYCYDVPFVQQLGWFGDTGSISPEHLVEALFNFSSYGDYNFNYNNTQVAIRNGMRLCNNYVLDLSVGYERICTTYKGDLQNNLKKSAREDAIFGEGQLDEASALYKQLYRNKTPHVTEKDFTNFYSLCISLMKQSQMVIRSVSNKHGKTLAIALLLKDDHRLYNMMNSTLPEGRKVAANHFLIDNLIQEYSGRQLLLDLEGSDIEGIKHFYKNFGAVNQPYHRLHFNNLPLPLKMFKR